MFMKSKLKRIGKSAAHEVKDVVILVATEIADTAIVAGQKVVVDGVKDVAVNVVTVATTQVLATTIIAGTGAAVTPVGVGIGLGLASYGIYKALKN